MGALRRELKPPGAAEAEADETGPWAIRLHPDDAGSAASLRLIAGLEICETAGATWIRGPRLGADLARSLRKIPGRRFRRDATERLFRPGARVPVGSLPGGPWMALAARIQPVARTAALPAKRPEPAPLQLTRSGGEEPSGLIIIAVPVWGKWAAEAPEARLQPLHFAAAGDGRVAVAGRPLPPLPGLQHTLREGIALPAGHDFSPPVDAAFLRALLHLEPGDLALFREDGAWERIPAASWVPASRSAARLTVLEAGR